MFLDVTFGPDYQSAFDNFTDGLLGDRFTANGIIQPKFTVAQRRYRLRLYNLGPSRFDEFWLTDGKHFIAKPFCQISSDGNLLPNAIKVYSVNTIVGERIDVVVDFGALAKLYPPGTPLYLVNRLDHDIEAWDYHERLLHAALTDAARLLGSEMLP